MGFVEEISESPSSNIFCFLHSKEFRIGSDWELLLSSNRNFPNSGERILDSFTLVLWVSFSMEGVLFVLWDLYCKKMKSVPCGASTC
jgi:hypothetical protein